MAEDKKRQRGKKSIFRSLFVPLFLIMILQALIFYFAAVYGGIDRSVRQNSVDILSERLINRKNEVETRFNNTWAHLEPCLRDLGTLYSEYENEYGEQPLAGESQRQVDFLGDSSELLISTLRQNKVNGIFLILNDRAEKTEPLDGAAEPKYGLCIRDADQESNYTDAEDLVLERAPASIVGDLGCSLDSWWESKYSFASREDGEFYYCPLDAAWDNPGAEAEDLAFFSGAHRLSDSDPMVVSYSVPLVDGKGYPYGVIGVELTTKYLASLLPNGELNEADKSCYVLALSEGETGEYVPIVGTGALYNRCFDADTPIKSDSSDDMGGFVTTGLGDVELYGEEAGLRIYNNNNPFENKRLTLLALVESDTLFAYSEQIKRTLLTVSLVSLLLGLAGLVLASRRFAMPIVALAERVRGMRPQAGFQLGRLGITEIDQLVDSLETLNRNVSRSSARSEFFSRMSHDMRTPMNAIISFSSPELLEGESEAVKDDYLSKIHSSGQYLLGLINEVLDMTKIESNRMELRVAPIRARRLLESTVPIIEKLASEKGVRFSKEISADEELYVSADEQHINQIVMNLLSNAVKFTPAGGSVRFGAELKEAEAGHVDCHITVSDTGVGISEEFMENLYTPFEQENVGREGTGLGLSIAKKLVDLMGGEIHCESRKGEGTTFTVYLSLPSCEEPEQTAASGPELYASLAGKRVLCCEDQPLNTQIICRLLERKGVTVDCAGDGRQGVAMFANSAIGAYDAILMDIRMPNMDGLEAARAIRALEREDAGTVPVIAMTANAFEEDREASRAAGMDSHLSKPVDAQRLYAVLEELTGRRDEAEKAPDDMGARI